MLIKGKRTFDSFLSAIAKHVATESDWEVEDDKDEYQIVFGSGEWVGQPTFDEDHPDILFGIELFCDQYKDADLIVVEKAVGMLEGIEWAFNLGAAPDAKKLPERGRRSRKRVKEERRDDTEE